MGGFLMKMGLILLGIGFLLTAYGYLAYQDTKRHLVKVKNNSKLLYYLGLGLNIAPAPLWSFLVGLAAIFVGLILFLTSIPFTI